ncbi:MAG: hypothetical protein AAFR79_05300 [Pseudomonadota bacterium]
MPAAFPTLGARQSGPDASFGIVAVELDVTATQLKTWKLELDAGGSAAPAVAQIAKATELALRRRDTQRFKEEAEVLRKASAYFAEPAAKP